MTTVSTSTRPTSGSVYDFSKQKSTATLKKAPTFRKDKTRELIREQFQLVERLNAVQSMLDALTNTRRDEGATTGKVLQYQGGLSTTGNADPLARQQSIENALSSALHLVRNNDTPEALQRATGRAIRAASLLKQQCGDFAQLGGV